MLVQNALELDYLEVVVLDSIFMPLTIIKKPKYAEITSQSERRWRNRQPMKVMFWINVVVVPHHCDPDATVVNPNKQSSQSESSLRFTSIWDVWEAGNRKCPHLDHKQRRLAVFHITNHYDDFHWSLVTSSSIWFVSESTVENSKVLDERANKNEVDFKRQPMEYGVGIDDCDWTRDYPMRANWI